MDGNVDFTVDPTHFGDFAALVDTVKEDGLRFVVIIDPAIAANTTYATFNRGNESQVFIKWSADVAIPDDQPADNTLLGNVFRAKSKIDAIIKFFWYRLIAGLAGRKDCLPRFLQELHSPMVDRGDSRILPDDQIRWHMDRHERAGKFRHQRVF